MLVGFVVFKIRAISYIDIWLYTSGSGSLQFGGCACVVSRDLYVGALVSHTHASSPVCKF